MNTLHLISHTHWDREWHQTFQQFRLRLVHLVDGLLDILENDPRYLHFMLDGQTIVLEDYLQIRPEREADLRQQVQNGRLLIGPWYLMPDEFLVGPEAIIRNFLEGDRIARRFGPKMLIGYIPDPFGHIGQMPQILRGFGMQAASLWRGVQDQPNEFWWQSPDGSRVLMAYLSQSYGNAAGILKNGLDEFVSKAREQRDVLAAHSAGTDFLLMHGTDHQEADPATAEAVAYAAGKLDGDRLIHSSLPAYFAAVQASVDPDKLPVVTGELRSPKHAPLLPGVLSTRMWIKQRNRACENLLETWAEPFSAWAQAIGEELPDNLRDPQAVLRQAWRLLLQCHPHDSICGCSIDQVHDEMRPRFDQAEQIGEEITRQSLAALASAITTAPPASLDAGAGAVVVFNPSTTARTDTVSATIDPVPESGAFELVDENGAVVPFEAMGTGGGSFEMDVDPAMARMGINMMAPGSDIAGMRLVGIQVSRTEPGAVLVEIQSGAGEPDRAAWESARADLLAFFKDPAILRYHLAIRGGASSQVLFAARDVPGLGYRTYRVREKAPAPAEPVHLSLVARAIMPLAARLAANPAMQKRLQRLMPDPAARPPFRIGNDFFLVEAQPDGSLDIRDKRTGTLYRGQNRFVDGGDRGDTYNYSKPDPDQLVSARVKSIRVERGMVRQTLEIHLELTVAAALATDEKTRSAAQVTLPLTSRVTLIEGSARVDIHTEVDNRARDHRLRVHFAAPFAVSEADYDGHFEVVRRPVGVPPFDGEWSEQPRPEVPQRAFTAVSDGKNGLLIANRGLPEVEVLPNQGECDIAVTLLRCVGWLSRNDFPERHGPAGPVVPTPGAQMPGTWAFDYTIIPFREADRFEAYQQAYAFQTPLRAVSAGSHAGTLPARGSFLQVSPAEFVVSAIKTAEDGHGWIVRGYNLKDEPIRVSLTPLSPDLPVERVNLAEAGIGPLNAGEPVEARAHEIVTLRFGRPVE